MPDAGHISEHDLEWLVLRMVRNEAERVRVEEHLLGCGQCAQRARQARQYVLHPTYLPNRRLC